MELFSCIVEGKSLKLIINLFLYEMMLLSAIIKLYI